MKKSSPKVPVMNVYDPAKIEKKWQKKWASSRIYKTTEDSKKDKFYVLDMFPYPSGEGLHVGHPKGYIATDVISRMKRMQGNSVLHPMGFDAFGLPAENYALKTKTHPEVAVKKNVARYKKQLEILGFDYDWSREVNTTDPAYYKWTQWIFLQLLKKGLAYESYEPINWCPVDKTGLANEDIENGRCERCGTPVEKKLLKQWVLKITDYAERLLTDLDATEYVMPVIEDKVNPHQPGKPLVKRNVVHAIVFNPQNKKYLIIRNKKFAWDTDIIGGIEEGESPVEAARREIREETGYTDLEFKRILGGPTEAHYYTKHKGENRIAYAQGVYFELKSDARVPIAEGESPDNEVIWIDEADFVPGKMVNSELPIWLERLKDPTKGQVKPLLDWPSSIKELQRNWIGKSEGAEIEFTVVIPAKAGIQGQTTDSRSIKVFTTRPDTLFGVTYVVLAPEHKLVKELLTVVENKSEVEEYISRVANKTEIERTDTTKEKTGIELKGIKVINPANNEEVPLWIADYVLADYGTGAVMAVPAHDERDYEFAKTYQLPVKQVIAPETGIKRNNEERRDGGCAVIFDPEQQKYAVGEQDGGRLRFFGGGVDETEDLKEGVLREVREESGLYDFDKIELIHTAFPHFYNILKNVNRIAKATCYLIILKSNKTQEVKLEEHEKFKLTWFSAEEIEANFHKNNDEKDVDHWLWFLNNSVGKAIEMGYDKTSPKKYRSSAYLGNGLLINSSKFDNRASESVKKEITSSVGGKWVTKYKLRDWVFSRQRYWGEPIPVIHCASCGVVPVPEKDLPVKLPKVKSYEPTGTGESPLAAIDKWVNVKCPQCKGKAKRETNTMPQWAGSSWYYLRYMDAKNKKALVDSKKEKYWAPVDLYVGGAEHATRHLIYARFWHKFLHDIGVVSTSEPFIKLQHVGLIMGEDGRKMSKRFGNVVNPDDIVKTFGADTMRVYEMFMGPFDQQIAWNTSSMVGSRRFIERIWKLSSCVIPTKVGIQGQTTGGDNTLDSRLRGNDTVVNKIIHKTIKKVTDDIENLHFNTAISSLMIAVNEIEKTGALSRNQFETLLQLIAPFAPHVAEELWTNLGNKKSIHISTWPTYDPALAVDDEVTIMVQVNGKVRGSFNSPPGTSREDLEQRARRVPEVEKWLTTGEIRKVIVVPDRLVNIVIS